MATTTNYGWTLPEGWLTDMDPAIQAIDTILKPLSVTLTGVTPVNVAVTGATAASTKVIFNRNVLTGTPGHISCTVTNNQLAFVSTGTETSTVTYLILKV